MIVLPFYCNLHLIHTFHFHLKYDYSVLKHISPVPSNYREMKITGSSRHQEGCRSPGLQGRQLARLHGVRGGDWREMGAGVGDREGGQWAGAVGERVQVVEREGTHAGGRLLRAPAPLLYKFIISWQSAHLLFHSFQVHDLILNTCSRKQVPVNSEVWFSLFWRQQKRRGAPKAKASLCRLREDMTLFRTRRTLFRTRRLPTSILKPGVPQLSAAGENTSMGSRSEE